MVVSLRYTLIHYPIVDRLFHNAYVALVPAIGMSDTFAFVPLILLSGAMKRDSSHDSARSTQWKLAISFFLAC